ncbi:M20/M25/M40 family metallo-hydrolase [Candidatus Woesebacteria bacterium]|nr:M20/M25/M40 family metallo-hydrolase [Candidatus Woesebacteria bacterium]MCD8507551.1 M20/M25/M40 family metallo-hydrolase [Candidatus Woesebacteria bacterium]MCD8527392.1 M20/M25/M40 family metallo-hydrolase [Candidatus Woesebacteria bacterium]MCD8546139.1 M20/M25/M40 family metallo-hydrolase [Candidatus Woesebacteria bacterium]
MNNEAIELLKQLIEIPSYVDDQQGINETKLVNYIEEWVANTLTATIEKQPLGNDRYNLIIKKGNPDTLFLAHTDTVAPSDSSQRQAIEKGGEIWGRGASDMKSGLAALLLAARNNPQANNFWIVLYADEEYDFLGMKGFLKEYPDLKPQRIISADGSDLQVGYACRGLIELRLRVFGKSGHAAKGNGRNAIDATFRLVAILKEILDAQTSVELGKTSLNLAYIFGGQKKADSLQREFLTEVGQAGNIIPDICECVIDIRPANPKVTAQFIQKQLSDIASKNRIEFEVMQITHDYSAWITPKTDIEKIVPTTNKTAWSDPQDTGYLDLQMMWQQYDQPSALMFGGGLGKTGHSNVERIPIKNYQRTVEFFSTLMEKLCK